MFQQRIPLKKTTTLATDDWKTNLTLHHKISNANLKTSKKLKCWKLQAKQKKNVRKIGQTFGFGLKGFSRCCARVWPLYSKLYNTPWQSHWNPPQKETNINVKAVWKTLFWNSSCFLFKYFSIAGKSKTKTNQRAMWRVVTCLFCCL